MSGSALGSRELTVNTRDKNPCSSAVCIIVKIFKKLYGILESINFYGGKKREDIEEARGMQI